MVTNRVATRQKMTIGIISPNDNLRIIYIYQSSTGRHGNVVFRDCVQPAR